MEAGSEAPGGDNGSGGPPVMGSSEWDGAPRAACLATQFATPLDLADYLEDESDAAVLLAEMLGETVVTPNEAAALWKWLSPWRSKRRRLVLGITERASSHHMEASAQGSGLRPVQLCTPPVETGESASVSDW
eukprot:6466517-Amphidinium_carterae.1